MGIPISLQDGFDAFERIQLEREVQNLVGPIPNIERLSRASLYGIRDCALRRTRAVTRQQDPRAEQY